MRSDTAEETDVNDTEQAMHQADVPSPGVEGTGATVDEATTQALAELGAERHEVVVDVISRGGSRPAPGEHLSSNGARVRVSRIDAQTARGRELLAALLDQMEIPARVSVRPDTRLG